ncbi:MAG: amidoligase family protein [Bacilli bacterium]
MKCYHCENEFEEKDLTTIDDQEYCEDCKDELFRLCDNCSEYTQDQLVYVRDTEEYICYECASSNTYFVCDCCGEYAYHENSDNNITICNDCRENYYVCYHCDNFVHSDDAIFNEYNEETYCEYCYDNHAPKGNIHDYDYKPDPIFYKTEDEETNTYFGIELEIDGAGEDEDNAEIIMDEINHRKEHIYCKHDGSLNDGFEIVSHPMTYNYIQKIKSNFKNMLEKARELDYTSHDSGTCGLHIHISRDAFGMTEQDQDYNITKILYLFEKHWNKMVKFSRRTESQLNEWAKSYLTEDEKENIIPNELLNKAKNAGRYFAVNLENEHTIEFRLFRGTLKYNTFMATIQFLHFLTDNITNINIAELQQITWKELTNKIDKGKYQELINYLEERNI